MSASPSNSPGMVSPAPPSNSTLSGSTHYRRAALERAGSFRSRKVVSSRSVVLAAIAMVKSSHSGPSRLGSMPSQTDAAGARIGEGTVP